jgi:hypothetical protein
LVSRLVRTSVITLVLLMLLGSCKFFEDPARTNPMDPLYSKDTHCSAVSAGANYAITWTRYKGTSGLTAVHVINSVVPADIRNAVRDYTQYSNDIKHAGTITSVSVTNLNWAKANSVNSNAVNYFAVVVQSGTQFEGSTIDSVP